MSRMKTLFTTMCAAFAVLGFTATAQAQTSSFDILGLRTGMTEQEARDALKAVDANAKLRVVTKRYQYHDGIEVVYTEEFLDRIELPDSREGSLTLYFSPPPKEQRVFAVKRSSSGMQNPPTVNQLRDTLVQKFGEPAFADSRFLEWDAKGGPACLRQPKRRTLFAPDSGRILKAVQNRKIADVSQCAAVAQYELQTAGGFVQFFYATIADVGAWAAAEQAANQWVAGLAAEAKKAQAGKGSAPKL